MRLLDRYLLRELLIPFSYCLSGFFIFWLSSDLLTDLDAMQKRHLTALDVAEYYAVRAPELVVTVLPLAFLLALLYTLSNHARHNEITAIRAAGVSLVRVALPYLAVGLGLTGASFAMNEWWVPESAARAEAVWTRRLPKAEAAAADQWEHNVGFVNTRDNRKWLIAAFNLETYAMRHLHVEWTLPDETLRVIEAEAASWTEGAWWFSQVRELVYPPGRGAEPGAPLFTNQMVMTDLTETPAEILSEIKVSKIGGFKEMRKTQLSIREILRYKRLHTDQSAKVTLMDTSLHARLAAPWTCVVVVLIALPFGAQSGRRNVFVGVASSIVICFAYFVLQQVTLAVGTRGLLVPWMAAWSPNAIFGLIGLLLSWRIR
jgi:lipopolysaccharide export system permease protein